MSVVMGDALVQGNVVLGHTTASAPAAATYPVVYYKLNDNVFNEDVDNHSNYGGSDAHSSSYGMTVQDSSDAGNNFDAKIIRHTYSGAPCDPIAPGDGWPYGNTRMEFTSSQFLTAPASFYQKMQGALNLGTGSLLDPGTTDAFSVSIWAYLHGPGWFGGYKILWHRWSANDSWDGSSCGAGDYFEGYDAGVADGDATNRYRGFYIYLDEGSPAKIGLQLACDGDDLGGAAMRAIRRTDAVVERDEWNHIVMTYSSASLHVYVNGSSVGGDETSTSGWDYASTTMPAAVRTNPNWPTQIGGQALPSNQPYLGTSPRGTYIQEASYWDIKLSATQVATLYGSGTPPDLDGGI